MERSSTNGRIVVGVDGSAPSKRALHWAAQEAVVRGARLDVVHTWTVPHSMYSEVVVVNRAPFEEEARTILDDAVESLTEPGAVPADLRAVLVEDDGATGILRAAAGADLLVVGSRGRGGFVALLLGSVSQRCVVHAPGAVAVVPPTWDMDGSDRVVVGGDGSDASYGALHWALDEAARRDAGLDVVNAYNYRPIVTPFGPLVAIDRDALETASRALLEEMVAGARDGVEARPRAIDLIPSSVAATQALLEAARGADLLVVGSRGLGTFGGLLLGSVSQQCIHHATCPIVVVHPPQTPHPEMPS
jgi:nucleotide-binding universal stress UspA family protein